MRVLLILLVCQCLTGCLAYGYPSVSRTPAIWVDEPGVKAVRVTHGLKMWGPVMTGPFEFEGGVEELPIENGEIQPQQDAYLAYYYLAFPVARGWYQRSFEVRLYRRGYETRVIEPQPLMDALFADSAASVPEPRRAETIEAREKAIDDVAPDSAWSDNARVNEFVAGEYLTLADSPELSGPEHEQTRLRLVEKAETARKSAKMSKIAPDLSTRGRSLVQTTAVP
jgi:hypothetical protein